MKIFARCVPVILSAAGAVGVVATAVLAVKATPKAQELIRERAMRKDEALTRAEKVQAAWKCYIPAAGAALGTIFCIAGASVLSRKQQASIMSAYALTNTAFGKYKGKVKELFGEGAHEKVLSAIGAETSDYTPITAESCYELTTLDFGGSEEEKLFYDTFSGRYFNSTVSRVIQAEYHLNRNYALGADVSLNDFYKFLGISEVEGGDDLTWSVPESVVWIDFNHTLTVTDDGLECGIIDMVIPPCACEDE